MNFVKNMSMGVLAIALTSNAHAGWADELSKGLGILGSVLGAASGMSVSQTATGTALVEGGFIQPTDAQKNAIASKLKTPNVSGATARALAEAAPTLQPFLETVSCSDAYDMKTLGRFTTLNGADKVFSGAFSHTNYHPKNQCMTVTQIGNFNMLALNALALKVMFVSDVSGESSSKGYVLIKQADGQWLVDDNY